ncbi:signal recognition particle 14 [Rhinolophus ferrumequinum]|uniref:Signal recognition particle 14 kDa protein n=1 Tax=Rhinolophus ferrumequinum TaxID=59479 RepID=A0A7J7XSC1_RHIFE|nr:signal recognition particle 14 [Rhinolophus ferrumequinum]
MVLLESEQFLTELTRLFQKCRLSGSVFITLKKYDGRTKPIPRKGSVEGFEPSDNKCLLRATDGKKKISTVVSSKEVNKFQMAYSNLLRANMDGLKKRDKKSKSKKGCNVYRVVFRSQFILDLANWSVLHSVYS